MADFCRVMETFAPTGLAQEWDNVGLLAGDPAASVERILLTIDLTPEVVREAIHGKAALVMAYHPPIFRPVGAIRADGPGAEACVFRCIENRIAVYAPHTALDAAEGGTNDVLARLCGIRECEPLEYVDEPGPARVKLAVYVPAPDVEKVADALFAAGAGHIGDYSHCSNRIACTGTFVGGASTNPTIGQRGRLEYVDEIRLEAVLPSKCLPAAVKAMVDAHPYEEPAFDVYPLLARAVRGIGRVGVLPASVSLNALAKKLKRATRAHCVQIVGSGDHKVRRAVVVAGAAGTLPLRLPPVSGDVIITGEIRHHDALTLGRLGVAAIALGHWASERPVLTDLARRLAEALRPATIVVSDEDRGPFNAA